MIELAYETIEIMTAREVLELLDQLHLLKVLYQNEGVSIMKKDSTMEVLDGR